MRIFMNIIRLGKRTSISNDLLSRRPKHSSLPPIDTPRGGDLKDLRKDNLNCRPLLTPSY